ncbi:MAG: pyrroloquinoline quinone biosynthesis protein PqqB [Lewinellaceae bacterium]|nr:pyrroloquinoline quinone biosynthesis protein PqqB [Phaeodactylibacter sp.]MCB9348615.1 pyrroloquinoline quinone biosynthesis protein PqqB [Lewinellaceae bacterium]
MLSKLTLLLFLSLSVFSLQGQDKGPFLMVLGIAQDAGYPQADCRKDCCRKAWEGELPPRKVSCLALADPATGRFWLVDATPDFREQLHEMAPYGQLSGILLTHAHIGHYTGLMHLGREVMGAKEVPVYAMPRMRAFLENNGPWGQLVQLRNIEPRNLTADSTLTLSRSLQITPLSVPHRDEYSETVGFLIEGPDKRALYIPDIDKWQLWERDILELIRQVDIAFLDGTFFANGEIPGRDMSEIPHPFIEESLALFGSLPEEERAKVHFIHFNHTNPLLDAEGAAARRVREMGCGVGEEGMRFSLGGKN